MANEPINILAGDLADNYDVLFLYTINSPKALNGQPIVVTPSSTLPQYADQILDASDKSALDAGTVAFDVYQHPRQGGLAVQQAQLREQFAKRQTEFNVRYDKRFQYIGTRLSATPAAGDEEDPSPPRAKRERT